MNQNKICDENSRLMKFATTISVVIASIIVFIKIYAWVVSDSLSLLSSLIDSILDVLSSVVNFVAIRYALIPPDDDHRFGHGKAEDLAALIQSLLISFSSCAIIFHGIKRIFVPVEIDDTDIGINVMIISTILTIGLVIFQRNVINKTKSKIVEVDFLHYITDIIVNCVVIFSLFVSAKYDLFIFDTIFAIAIAVYILFPVFGILKRSFDNLMDKEFDDIQRNKIIEIIFSNRQVKGIHDLKTRTAGMLNFIQFDLELDGKLTLKEAHDIAENIEKEIAKEFPNSIITIHQDPYEDIDIDLVKNRVLNLK